MQCRFCLFNNAEDEDRCQRCGKRLSGEITVDGIAVAGATALAPRPRTSGVDTSSGKDTAARALPRAAAAAAAANAQTSLFIGEVSSNVIPFESFPRPAGNPAAKTELARIAEPGTSAKQPVPSRQVVKKQPAGRRASDAQGSLELEILQPAPQAPRTLKTNVEASIYCDAPVAAPMHRFVAAILDTAMILIGFGMFVAIFQSFGDGIQADKFNGIMLGCAAVLIMMFYGLVFAISGRETAGQNWTELRLINFDGLQPDVSSRALRFAGCWLSFCACGVGLLWALLDEENLTWHDHMSKTFLTVREAESTFFRERPR